MLNPSDADHEKDDPTQVRCMGFARREGAGGTVLGNLCAFRSPYPEALETARDPFGPDNEKHLCLIALVAARSGMPIVCGWGVNGAGRGDAFALDIFCGAGVRLVCLGLTKHDHPRHPLYVSGDAPLLPYQG